MGIPNFTKPCGFIYLCYSNFLVFSSATKRKGKERREEVFRNKNHHRHHHHIPLFITHALPCLLRVFRAHDHHLLPLLCNYYFLLFPHPASAYAPPLPRVSPVLLESPINALFLIPSLSTIILIISHAISSSFALRLCLFEGLITRRRPCNFALCLIESHDFYFDELSLSSFDARHVFVCLFVCVDSTSPRIQFVRENAWSLRSES